MVSSIHLSSSTVNTSIPFFFFFNDTATTEIYTLSLHDALPICLAERRHGPALPPAAPAHPWGQGCAGTERTMGRRRRLASHRRGPHTGPVESPVHPHRSHHARALRLQQRRRPHHRPRPRRPARA